MIGNATPAVGLRTPAQIEIVMSTAALEKPRIASFTALVRSSNKSGPNPASDFVTVAVAMSFSGRSKKCLLDHIVRDLPRSSRLLLFAPIDRILQLPQPEAYPSEHR